MIFRDVSSHLVIDVLLNGMTAIVDHEIEVKLDENLCGKTIADGFTVECDFSTCGKLHMRAYNDRIEQIYEYEPSKDEDIYLTKLVEGMM